MINNYAGSLRDSTFNERTGLTDVAFSPDGQRLVVPTMGSKDSIRMRLWETASGREGRPLMELSRSRRFSPTMSPDGNWLAAESGPEIATLWEVVNGTVVPNGHDFNGGRAGGPPGETGERPNDARGLVLFSEDGGRLVLVYPKTRTVHVWDVRAGKELLAVRNDQAFSGKLLKVAISSDGTRLLTVYTDWLGVWDVHSGKALLTPAGNLGDSVTGAAMSGTAGAWP